MPEGAPTRNVFSRTTRVEHCPAVQTNVRWPAPVDQRLNELVQRLSDDGFECTRSQLVAALVANASTEARHLRRLVERYRQSHAGSVVLQATGKLRVQTRKPGRRPR